MTESQINNPSESKPVPEKLPLAHLAYVSTQTRPLPPVDLLELLQEAQRINRERGITGLLLHKDGSFFQILEGSPEEVGRTFDSIESDDRHHQVEVLMQGGISDRDFPDWRMGFMDLDGVDVSLLSGYSDFLQSTDEPREFLANLSRGQRLALMFKKLGA